MRFLNSVLAACGFLVFSASASADPSTVSRLGWVTNGDVRAAVQVGNTLYVAGTFTRVAPSSNTLGSFFGVSMATGEPVSSLPLVDGIVNDVEPDGAGGYYIGGEFTRVQGVPRPNLAHVLADGSVDVTFAAAVTGGPIATIARGDTHLFIGGAFSTVNSTTRSGFAALDPITGSLNASLSFPGVVQARKLIVVGANLIAVTSGNALAFTQVGALLWSQALGSVDGRVNDAIVTGSRLIVGGLFSLDRPLVSLDVSTGVVDQAWHPTVPVLTVAQAVAVSADVLYVAGTKYSGAIGIQPQPTVFAVNIPTAAAVNWTPNPNGPVSALATSLSGTVFLGGQFTTVGGVARDGFAEVDATGATTAWTADVYASNVRTLHLDGSSTLLIGARTGVRSGSARTNLAAFNLESNTLLPWAPPMPHDVVKLAAIGNSIYVGHSVFVNALTRNREWRVSAVDAISGSSLPWTPPGALDLRLLGADTSHVYVTGSAIAGGGLLARLNGTTGALDRGWRPNVPVEPNEMVISGRTMYLAVGTGLRAVDVDTGTVSSWNPTLLPQPPGPSIVNVRGLAVDGRTVYTAVTITGSLTSGSLVAVDGETGLVTTSPTLQATEGAFRGLAVADGQLIAGANVMTAFHASGQPASWNPGYRGLPIALSGPNFLVTPTDLIVIGYEGAVGPVQGIAVLPRTPAVAPTGLRAATLDNQVTLAWNAPSAPPAGYVVDVAPVSNSPSPTSLPTGSAATTVTGIAGNGIYYARVRAAGAPAGPASGPTNEIALVVGCSSAPAMPPLKLSAQVSGNNVTLSWIAPPFTAVSRYVLEAGSSAGASNIGTFTLPASQTSVGAAVPNGAYFVRARAANACGQSTDSNQIFFTVGSGATMPAAPTGLSATITGSTVSLQWNASPGATSYLLEVGSAHGLSDIGALPLSTTTFTATGVPRGLYYVRVRALNGAGLSAPSSEVALPVFP